MEMKANRRKGLILVVIVVMLLTAAVMPAMAKSKLVRLTLNNKSDQTVNLQLNGSQFYYLTVGAGESKVFTVNRETYSRTTWACGLTSSGTLDMSTQVTLNFMPCEGPAPNQGTPTFEKVSLFDSPTGKYWRYQDDDLDQIIE
jgi:hypothetical protein